VKPLSFNKSALLFIRNQSAEVKKEAFEKRTQKTPLQEIETGKKRLKELLYG
jgi:hypothetical protein